MNILISMLDITYDNLISLDKNGLESFLLELHNLALQGRGLERFRSFIEIYNGGQGQDLRQYLEGHFINHDDLEGEKYPFVQAASLSALAQNQNKNFQSIVDEYFFYTIKDRSCEGLFARIDTAGRMNHEDGIISNSEHQYFGVLVEDGGGNIEFSNNAGMLGLVRNGGRINFLKNCIYPKGSELAVGDYGVIEHIQNSRLIIQPDSSVSLGGKTYEPNENPRLLTFDDKGEIYNIEDL